MRELPAWLTGLGRAPLEIFGRTGEPLVAFAPGRVNLIGEHTDYNDGWVLPVAIDRYAGVAAVPRGDSVLRAHSVVFGETAEVVLDELTAPGGTGWIDYVAGTAWALRSAGHHCGGADLVVDGDVPLGSGLSSSAALEMAVARALCGVWELPWQPLQMALLGQRTEGEYIGVKGGVMDQFTAVNGEAGCALLLDCRSLEHRAVALPQDAVVVVMDTGASRSLAGSAYNDRSAACRDAVEALRRLDPSVRALRDVSDELLEAARPGMDPTVYRRARFVVEEIARPAAMARCLEAGDLRAAGRLMDASHDGLRDLYEVSSTELDLMTGLAREHCACFGARLTGAGFGGCAVALVAAEGVRDFVERVGGRYRERVELPSSVFPVRAGAGADILSDLAEG